MGKETHARKPKSDNRDVWEKIFDNAAPGSDGTNFSRNTVIAGGLGALGANRLGRGLGRGSRALLTLQGGALSALPGGALLSIAEQELRAKKKRRK